MQRRALALQADADSVEEAADPLEEDPARLAEIRVPALVAAGEREQFVDFRQGAEAIARAMPHARNALIQGAGHLAPLESPRAFRELLLEFLPGL
jgi:3-oxoadipate enol-lactonase